MSEQGGVSSLDVDELRESSILDLNKDLGQPEGNGSILG